ncbi:MAG: hypothetical protein R6U28_12080 [Cyclonatronaceae bacterium]
MNRSLSTRLFLFLFLAGLLAGLDTASAQVYENIYRPARPAWQQLRTPHFQILFRKGEDEAALRSGRLLEDQYDIIQSLVGGSLSGMPVVLNSRNDLSNGYVTTRNFRIEVEIPRMKGKSMNPSDGSWLNTVMPHELVHALHLNVTPPFGLSAFIRPFSPDMARTMHMVAPLGMIEGIAVFHESHRQYGLSGRGNHPYFTRQFDAVYDSRHRWSLSQMLMDPVRTWPFDRHYIGGHEFIHWLQYEYGMETTKNTIRFTSRWPFLGYGSALWYHTGERPSSLYRRFKENQIEAENRKATDRDGAVFKTPSFVTAQRVRKPFWISDETVVFYALSYNQRPGLYSFNKQSKRTSLFLETRSTRDYRFALNPDRSRLLYSRYHRHPYYHNVHRMRAYEVRMDTAGRTDRVDHVGTFIDPETGRSMLVDRIHAPVYGPDGSIWALQTHHERNILLSIGDNRSDTLLIPEKGHLVELAFHPVHRDSLVILANRDGLQGLWFLHRDDLDGYNRLPPAIAWNQASVYDPAWHPDGDRLLFTSDAGGRMNLYEYHAGPDRVFRLTDHRYGIMEGSYRPDGQQLAAVQLRKNRFELVLIDTDQLDPEAVPDEHWKDPPFSGPSPDAPLPANWSKKQETIHNHETGAGVLSVTDKVGSSEQSLPESWELSKYRTGPGWLRPRSIFPYWENESGLVGHRFGAVLSGGDVLRRHSYYTELSTSNNRFWYDIQYRYSGFYPGFRFNVYQRPAQTTDFILDQQGTGLDFPLRLQPDRNTRHSSITLIPGMDYLRERAIDTDGEALSEWFERMRASLFLSYQHHLQQNIRDVQPNTGWILFSELNQDILTDADHHLAALRFGIYRFLTFRQKGNRSLRLGAEAVTQTRPFFDISGFYSLGFVDNVLAGVNNAGRFNTRYTIPLWHADRGQILLPFFLDRFYLVLFSDTVVPVRSRQYEDWIRDSRSLFGGGLRLQMRIFNFPIDIGVAAAFEPTRNNTGVIIGSF